HHAVPFAGPRQWVRILLGANVARCYVSGDGRRWSAVLDGYRQQNSGNTRLGGVVSSGVYLLRGDGARTITLREMAVAEPTGLRDAPGSAVAEQAFAFAFAADAGEWMKLVVENKPVGVDPIAWRCACAYKTLAHGPDPKLVSALWAGLIEDSLRLAPTFDARLAVLDAATAATSLGWEMPDAKPWFERYEALGAELIQSGDPAPWSKLRLPMIYSPLQARAWFDVEPAPLVRQELLELVGKGDWAGVRDVSRKIWAANLPIHPHQRMPHNRGKAERRNVLDLTEWADAIASRALPRQAGETVAISVDWRRPLVEQLSKEGYNLLAEFEAALKSKSYRDACQIVASCSPGAALGVAPDSQDPALMVSLPSAVALAMRETPDLQRTMEKEFGAVGKFRIREATGDADADAVEAATVQFFGTAAAAEAHVWLGDRALATGDFAAAGSQYRRAAETLGGKPSPSLEARRRLTAAFQGREYGTPVAAPVVLGDKTLDATAFEALVSAARTRSERAASLGDAAPLGSADAPPPPSEYTAKAFAQTSGEWGREHERLASKNVNAVGRLTTTLVAGNLFITHNRFQTIAFDLGSGQQKWSTGLGGQQGHAHKWTTPMRPLLVQGKLIVRRLTENGPELAAIELETGKVLWRQQPGHHVASDPLWIQQELFALGVSSVGSDQLQLELVSFALDTGEPVARRKLALFRNAWNSAIPCSAAASGDRIVAAAGGAVLCTDLLGQVLWLREQNWIPAKQDEAAGRLGVSTPIIADRRVYVSQPNVRTVDCLDLDGGRLQWRRTYEALQGLIGLAGPKRDVLVVALDEALEGVKLADGGSLWRRSGRLDLEGTVAGADSVLTVERIPTNNEQHRVQLSWLDPQSGKELASVPLAGTDQVKVEGRWPQVGPTVAAGGRYWVYFNAEERSPERKILEITATGPAPAQSPVDAGAAKYAQLSRRLIGEAAGFSPRWMLLASPENQRAGRQAQWENHPNVMLTYCTNEAATSWGGFVTLSADKPATLHLEVGHVNDAPYRVVVNAAGRTLGEWVVSPETAPSHWLTIDADLSSLAGRTTWVEIRQEPFQKRDSLAAWQKMEIVAP
ncbi:MAG TPA: PQQ-binding-like beta-propeller repeat protein, partial [Pirellulales bacterium]